MEFLQNWIFLQSQQISVWNIALRLQVGEEPDCSGIQLSSGDVNDGEGTGCAKFAEKNQDGEGRALKEKME